MYPVSKYEHCKVFPPWAMFCHMTSPLNLWLHVGSLSQVQLLQLDTRSTLFGPLSDCYLVEVALLIPALTATAPVTSSAGRQC